MTKNEIANYIVCNSNLSRSQAFEAIECVFNAISESLSKGNDVSLRGFATFRVHKTPDKKARNIGTGDTVIVPAHNTVKLILSKDLKEKMNK